MILLNAISRAGLAAGLLAGVALPAQAQTAPASPANAVTSYPFNGAGGFGATIGGMIAFNNCP